MTQTSITSVQQELWLRGLLTIAWSDGDFDAREKELITTLVDHPFEDSQVPVTTAELQANFESGSPIAENFLRSAVMVALADGVYSSAEDAILHDFCTALGSSQEILETLRLTLCDLDNKTFSPLVQSDSPAAEPSDATIAVPPGLQAPSESSGTKLDPLAPVRSWLDGMEIQDPKIARFLCKLIPAQCPFERDVVLFKKKIVHIPPMCKINPLYDQLVGLRFRSLSYLADVCKEDVSAYF